MAPLVPCRTPAIRQAVGAVGFCDQRTAAPRVLSVLSLRKGNESLGTLVCSEPPVVTGARDGRHIRVLANRAVLAGIPVKPRLCLTQVSRRVSRGASRSVEKLAAAAHHCLRDRRDDSGIISSRTDKARSATPTDGHAGLMYVHADRSAVEARGTAVVVCDRPRHGVVMLLLGPDQEPLQAVTAEEPGG